MQRKLSKELLGLAGEYAVASELCKRGMYAQLTLGSHKHTDILIQDCTEPMIFWCWLICEAEPRQSALISMFSVSTIGSS